MGFSRFSRLFQGGKNCAEISDRGLKRGQVNDLSSEEEQ